MSDKELRKPVGHDWAVTYRFEGEDAETMSVFGQIRAEDALREARYSLDGANDRNVGTYEILAVARTALQQGKER